MAKLSFKPDGEMWRFQHNAQTKAIPGNQTSTEENTSRNTIH